MMTPTLTFHHLVGAWWHVFYQETYENNQGMNIEYKEIWAVLWQNQQMTVCPAKTQISLGIRTVWSESSLCAHLGS